MHNAAHHSSGQRHTSCAEHQTILLAAAQFSRGQWNTRCTVQPDGHTCPASLYWHRSRVVLYNGVKAFCRIAGSYGTLIGMSHAQPDTICWSRLPTWRTSGRHGGCTNSSQTGIFVHAMQAGMFGNRYLGVWGFDKGDLPAQSSTGKAEARHSSVL